MEKISSETIELISIGIYHELYKGENLIHAVNVISNNNIYKLVEIYKSSRRAKVTNPDSKEYSRISGIEMLRLITISKYPFKSLIDDLPDIHDISVEEFEMIVFATFSKMPECKIHLIKFVSKFGGKSKISKSSLSKEIKEELISFLVIDKLAP